MTYIIFHVSLLILVFKGKKKRKDTICTTLADDTCEEPKIRMNKVVETTSGLGSEMLFRSISVLMSNMEHESTSFLWMIEGVTGNFFDEYLKRELLFHRVCWTL